jgi:hypothetical protein
VTVVVVGDHESSATFPRLVRRQKVTDPFSKVSLPDSSWDLIE